MGMYVCGCVKNTYLFVQYFVIFSITRRSDYNDDAVDFHKTDNSNNGSDGLCSRLLRYLMFELDNSDTLITHRNVIKYVILDLQSTNMHSINIHVIYDFHILTKLRRTSVICQIEINCSQILRVRLLIR